MNYSTLQSRLLTVLGRAPETICYELVTADINRELRLKVMQSTTTLTEAASIALPADFLEVVSLYRDTDPRIHLQPTTLIGKDSYYITSGTPRYFAITDGTLFLNPVPDGAETLSLTYIAKVDELADTASNDVLSTYPDIYFYGVLAHHAQLIGDERLAIWGPLYEKAKMDATVNDARQTYAGGPVKVRTKYATP